MRSMRIGPSTFLMAMLVAPLAAALGGETGETKPLSRIRVETPEAIGDDEWKSLEKMNPGFARRNREMLEYLPVDVARSYLEAVRKNSELEAMVSSPYMMALLATRIVRIKSVAELPKETREDVGKASAPDVVIEELVVKVNEWGLNYRNATDRAMTQAMESYLTSVKRQRQKDEAAEERRKKEEEREKERLRLEKEKKQKDKDKKTNTHRVNWPKK